MNNKNKKAGFMVLFFLMILYLPLNAQVFQKNYVTQGYMSGSHHFTESVTQTIEGNFAFLGWNLADLAFPKMTLIKINQYSNIAWQRTYTRCAQMLMGNCIQEDLTATTKGSCVKQTSDGGFILTGSINDKMILIKTNIDGSVVTWAKTFDTISSFGKYVIQTSDGGYICAGAAYDTTKSAKNIFVVKTTAGGALMWDRKFRISSYNDDVATSVAQLINGDFVITGYTTQNTTKDIILIRLNSAGNLLFANTYGSNNYSEEGHSIKKTNDGGYILSGYTTQTSHPLSASDPFIWKFNASDTPEFQKSYRVSNTGFLTSSPCYASQPISNQGYALFGVTSVFGTSVSHFSNYLLNLDSLGNPMFCNSYNDTVSGSPLNLSQTIWNDGVQLANGGYLLGGSSIPVSGNGLGYKLIKTNPMGESGCNENIVTPLQYTFAPTAEPISLTNLSTGTVSKAVDIVVKNPSIIEEFVCYEICTALPGNDTTICMGGSVMLGGGGPNGETALNGLPPYTYSWSSSPAGFNSVLEQPIVSPSVTTTYTLTTYDSDIPTPCPASASVVVNVIPNPTINGINCTPQSICPDSSATLAADAFNATSYAWSPATGLSSTTGATVTASPATTTTYTLTVTNTCNSETAFIVVPVNLLPAVIAEPDTICAGDTYMVNANITNANTFYWTTSGTGTFDNTSIENPVYTPSTVDVNAGTVILTVNASGCGTATGQTELSIFPLPLPPVFFVQPPFLCTSSSPVMLSGGIPLGGTYSGIGVSNNVFTPASAGVGAHTITYTISDTYSCKNAATDIINVFQSYPPDPICIVTLDSASNRNKIIWQKTQGNGFTDYVIYKLSGTQYIPIDTVPFSSVSEYIDYSSQPGNHADKYKIAAIDTCGNISNLSPFHETMLLQTSLGTGGYNLSCNKYIDESGAFFPDWYYLYKGTTLNNMVLFDSVSGGLSAISFNDNESNLYYYQIAVFKPSSCTSSKSVFQKSISNIRDNQNVGINDIKSEFYPHIYPNPANNKIFVETPDVNTYKSIQICDIQGCLLIQQAIVVAKAEVNIATLAPGMYFIHLEGEKESVVRRFVKE